METATSIELFVEILDRYVYYFDQKNESVCLILSVVTGVWEICLFGAVTDASIVKTKR